MPLSDSICPALRLDIDPLPPADHVIEHLSRSARGGRRLLLTGPLGSARTATLAAFLTQFPHKGFQHIHAAGLAPEQDHPAGVIYGLLNALRRHFDAADALPLDEAGLREALPGWLARLGEQPALIVIDHIDRITGADLTSEPDWLPPYLPPGVILVASCERGLLAERLRSLGWEGIDINQTPPTPDWGDSTVAITALADQPKQLEALRYLAVASAGLSDEQCRGLAIDFNHWAASIVSHDDGLWRFRHDMLRISAHRLLINGAADERRLSASIAAEISPGLEHAQWLARAADWSTLLGVLSQPDALIAWREQPFYWQQLWDTLPARDTAISHLIDTVRTHLTTVSLSANDLAECTINASRILAALDAYEPATWVREAGYTHFQRHAPETLAAAATAHHYANHDLSEVQHNAAIDCFRGALIIRQNHLGEDDSATRATRHALAAILEASGDLAGAIAEYSALLAEREKSLGRDSLDLLPWLANLGAAQRAANDLERARGPFERCVKIARAQPTGFSPSLALALDNLGGLLYAGHDYPTAQARYREAVNVTQTLFGPGHPATAAALHNLGTTLDAQEQFGEAQRCFRQALEVRTQALGREHAETATSLHNLAGVLDVIGQREEAETLYREAVDIWQAVVGNDHPATATSINNLADLLREAGRLDEAEPLYQDNLKRWQTLYGDHHPNTAMTAAELGGLYADAGRMTEAEPLLRQSVEHLEQMLGLDNGLTIDTLCRYAAMLRQQGRIAEGITLLEATYERAAGTTKVLSPRLQKLRRHLDGLRKAAAGAH